MTRKIDLALRSEFLVQCHVVGRLIVSKDAEMNRTEMPQQTLRLSFPILLALFTGVTTCVLCLLMVFAPQIAQTPVLAVLMGIFIVGGVFFGLILLQAFGAGNRWSLTMDDSECDVSGDHSDANMSDSLDDSSNHFQEIMKRRA